MKKLISISIALALLVTFMAPVAVAADPPPTDPIAYSKTPFGILGSAIVLVGDIVRTLPTDITDMIPMGLADAIPGITDAVGYWTWENLAWMTDMTGWSMVAVGDILTVLSPIGTAAGFAELEDYLGPVADVFYVLGARIFDKFGSLLVAAPDVLLPEPGLGLPVHLQTSTTAQS